MFIGVSVVVFVVFVVIDVIVVELIVVVDAVVVFGIWCCQLSLL